MAAAPTPQPSSRRSTRFSMRSKQIGQLLIENGDIQSEHIAKAIKTQEQQGGLLGQILVHMGACPAEAIANSLLKQVQVTDIQCEDVTASPEVLELVPREQCEQEKLCPFELIGKLLCIVMGNPLNRRAINAIEESTRLKVKPFKAPWPKIKELLDRSTQAAAAGAGQQPAEGAVEEEAPPAVEELPPEEVAPTAEEAPAPVEEAAAPEAVPEPEPVPEAEPNIQGLDALDESQAEVIETDARGLTRRKRPAKTEDAPVPMKKKEAKVNVDLDAFDASAGAVVVAGADAEEGSEEPLEEISASAAAAHLAAKSKPGAQEIPKFTQTPVAFFYEGGTVPPKSEQPTEEFLALVGTLPRSETLAESIGDYRQKQAEEKAAAAAPTPKPKEGAPKELLPEFTAAPAEAMAALALSDAEFQTLTAGFELDPAGEWTWQYVAQGPVTVEEYQTEAV